MDKIKAQAGDLITVQTDSIKHQYMESGDFETVVFESGDRAEGFGGLEELSKKHIYKIVKNDLHKDLAKRGVNIGHCTLLPIKVEHLSFPVEGEVRVNGEFDIPFKKKRTSRLVDTYFFDEAVPRAIATGLNISEREKMIELKESVEKAIVMLDQIVSKAHV